MSSLELEDLEVHQLNDDEHIRRFSYVLVFEQRFNESYVRLNLRSYGRFEHKDFGNNSPSRCFRNDGLV